MLSEDLPINSTAEAEKKTILKAGTNNKGTKLKLINRQCLIRQLNLKTLKN